MPTDSTSSHQPHNIPVNGQIIIMYSTGLLLMHVCVHTKSYPTLLWPPRTVTHQLLYPWDSPGKNTGVGCHFLLQRIFLTQESNPCLLHLLHWQADFLPLRQPQFISVQFSRSVMSDSLQPHELQHARLPCPSPTGKQPKKSKPPNLWYIGTAPLAN